MEDEKVYVQDFRVWRRTVIRKRPGFSATVRKNYIRMSLDLYEQLGSPSYVVLLHNLNGWGVAPAAENDRNAYLIRDGEYSADKFFKVVGFTRLLKLGLGYYTAKIQDGAAFFSMSPD